MAEQRKPLRHAERNRKIYRAGQTWIDEHPGQKMMNMYEAVAEQFGLGAKTIEAIYGIEKKRRERYMVVNGEEHLWIPGSLYQVNGVQQIPLIPMKRRK